MIIRNDVNALPFADASIDMIFSDPPYVAAERHTYALLAQEAIRLLKPGCFVAVMCGGVALNDIMRWFDDAGLQFFWLYQIGLNGQQTGVYWANGNQRVPVTTRTKHVLVYSKGPAIPRTATVGLYRAGTIDKRWHHWGQDIDSHRYYIDCLSAPGDLVLDPMAGGGTTAIACAILGRRWICGDLDQNAVQTIARRVSGDPVEMRPLPLFSEVALSQAGGRS